MSLFLRKILLASAAILVLSAGGIYWNRVRFHEIQGFPPLGIEDTRVLGYKVIHDAPDHLALEFDVYYAGREMNVFAGAVTRAGGEFTGRSGYRPDPVRPGRGRVRVLISMIPSDPETYFSDQIVVEMYLPGQPPFHSVSFPYAKVWKKISGGPSCHKDWGRGCGGV